MQRVPEPELMRSVPQVSAYSDANFTEGDQSFVDHIVDFLNHSNISLLPGSLILDLGCGPGNISELLASRWPQSDVIGIDGSSAMINKANTRLLTLKPAIQNLSYIIANLKTINIDLIDKDKGASLIVSNSLLHHLHNPHDLWLAVQNLAIPGSFMFHRDLRRPFDELEVDALCERYVSNAPSVLQHDFRASLIAAFTADEVREQLDQAGLGQFTVMEIDDRYLEVCGQW